MITVEKLQKKEKISGASYNAVNEEKLKTGLEVKQVKSSWWPVFIALAIAGITGYFLWKRGKQKNGEVSG